MELQDDGRRKRAVEEEEAEPLMNPGAPSKIGKDDIPGPKLENLDSERF